MQTPILTPGYYVTAELKVLDLSRLEAMKTALAELQRETLKESGCSLFTIHQDSEHADKIVLWERFDDEAAFQYHFTLAHTQDYFAQQFTEVVNVIKTKLLF